MTRLEKQELLRSTLNYTNEPKNLEEAYDYILYNVLTFCIENEKPLTYATRHCGLCVGYFDRPTMRRDMTIDTAIQILSACGILEENVDIYGLLGDSYDKFVYYKKHMHDLPFCKETIRKSIIDGTSLRLSTVVKYLNWLGVGFEDFFKYSTLD